MPIPTFSRLLSFFDLYRSGTLPKKLGLVQKGSPRMEKKELSSIDIIAFKTPESWHGIWVDGKGIYLQDQGGKETSTNQTTAETSLESAPGRGGRSRGR